jgi:tetratricopeptide (TPR) repeat protein
MVLDQDAWLAIQKDEEANLALSPEEAELLDSVHTMGWDGYPLFINGRAGSGKSTMLQYLAAEYVDFALRHDASRQPLYMTCSVDLLERARSIVRGLLTRHHRRLLEGVQDVARIDEVIRRCFVVFHEFLYSLLPREQQKDFPSDGYVNYARFRNLWACDFAKRPEAKRISPDVAWHTIRSYIKGLRSDRRDELGPEEFRSIPRRRRSVSETTYRQIYESVWCSWYKRLSENNKYWDDQDLAAAVLATGSLYQIDCPAVFCDEAQDFTPVELDIIYQLSLFARRSLRVEEVVRVPIVFAGDPLQTINPTGFRWDAVQAEFHERFSAVLDPRRRARVNVSYRELRFNYRSNPGIVKFCNLIQLVRAAALGARDIRPQEAWWVEGPVQTVCFAVDSPQTVQQLVQRPELVKLVNCEQGEESQYVQEDSILKNVNQEAEGVYRNVLGPTRAKGLEFPVVVLYRFGETAPKRFGDLLNGDLDLTSPETRLPFEYFFNRLYVAASRAKRQLIIVDSRRALEEFWGFASDVEIIDALMEKAAGGKALWQKHVTYLVPGSEGAWSGEAIDPREQATEYASQGRLKHDPYLLRQAALAYRSAGDRHEAGKCLANAEELEGKYHEAGDRYRELGLNEEAFRCYWVGQGWEALCDLASEEPVLNSRLESRAADFMIMRAKGSTATFLASFLDAIQDQNWLKATIGDFTWRLVLAELGLRLSKASTDERIAWTRANEAFHMLTDAGVAIKQEHLGTIAYNAGDFQRAVALWERSGSIESSEYRRAKATIAPFPENIIWFARLKDYGEVIRRWREQYAGRPTIDRFDNMIVSSVTDAALAEGDLQLAVTLLESKPDRERLAKMLAASLQQGDIASARDGAVIASRLLVRNRDWILAIRAAEDGSLPDFPGVQPEALRSMLKEAGAAAHIFRSVIEELAVSTELVSETSERKGTVTDFLHRQFIGKAAPRAEWARDHPELVGAAIERAGKIVDALQFYEDLERYATTEVIRKFAAERLVRNLERYAEYLQGRKDDAEAKQRRARAQGIRERYGLPEGRNIPDYPTISRVPPPSAPMEWTRGPFRITLSRAHARLRIEHRERFETITIDTKDRCLLGDAVFSALDPPSTRPRWQITGWATTISLFDREGAIIVLVEYPDDRFEIELSSLPTS